MTNPLDLVSDVVGLGTAIAKAADRPDDVQRAAFIGRASGRLRWAIDTYNAAKHPGRRRSAARIGDKWAAVLRSLGEPVPPLPWVTA